ncbi:MAG: restriction endonuclease subunit S [Bacteroidia bacterium]|nr:restriction endonuclease subunit S [Bacteroidia bacterium]
MKQGWEIKKLGEVCEISTGKSNTEDAIENGDFAFFDRSKIVKRSSKFLFDCDAIIVAGEGQTFLPKFYSGKFDLHQRAYAIYNFDKSVSVHYAYNYLIHFHKYFESVAVGATATSLRLRHFQDLPIPIPPIIEQQRIVSILDEALTAIAKAKANAEQNLLNANELFENAAQEIFTQKGINWEENLLGDFATFRNGINYTKGSKGEKIKIVGVKDFQDSYWVPDNDLVEVSLDGKINETDLLQEGDILAVRSNGNPQLIGRTLLAGKINEKVSHSGFTIRIRLNSKIVNPNYLCHFLKIQQTRKTLVESGNGVGIRSLNQGSLSSLKIPFPKSLKEQEAIIDKVDSIAEQSQKLKDIYQKKIDDLEELKKSILQKAFAGELKTEKAVAV